ncbi:MAG: UDP-glucose 6-dehydrogenase, partial [Treponema porcinum]|nr:UDP-glucose 6-dehydrogenase [Treponema porcinum]
MTIAVAGTGYVGLSNSILLSQHNKVYAVDIVQEKVDLINSKKSPIVDKEISEYLAEKTLNLEATTDSEKAYKNADFVIISTPTNYDETKNFFDTSSVEAVIDLVQKYNKEAVVIVKSTVPVGYNDMLLKKYPDMNILFSPEFLREGHALYDNLYPSRIGVSYPKTKPFLKEKAVAFSELLKQGAIKTDIPVLITTCTEAEAI